MTCRIAVLTFLAVAVAFCRSSRADEDGSFCTSRGYLAYNEEEWPPGCPPGRATSSRERMSPDDLDASKATGHGDDLTVLELGPWRC
jgi:hypothetical protein